MSASAQASSDRKRRPIDTPVVIAALGSLLLAIPGLWGFALIAAMVFGSPWEPDLGQDAARIFSSLFLLGLPLIGFYLLVGYWRAGLWGTPSRHSRRFWWLSAGYNMLGLVPAVVVAVWEAGFGGFGIPLVLSVPHIAWTGFMVRLGVRRARQVPEL